MTGLIVRGTFLDSNLFLLYMQVSLFFLFIVCLCVVVFFCIFYAFFRFSTPLQNAEGRKTVTGRIVLGITEFEVIFHCAHLALVSNESRCLQNPQQDTRCEGSGRFQNINYKKNIQKKKTKITQKASGQMSVLHRLSLWVAAGKILDK